MPHILILEDEAEIAEIIAIALKRDCHTSQIAPTAQAAGQHLIREAYDLLLLDVGLPDINGFDYLKILRAQHPRLPVIMLTAQDEETDRILGLELGADDYIGKPFSPRELNARIKALLRRTQRQPETSGTSFGEAKTNPPNPSRNGKTTPKPTASATKGKPSPSPSANTAYCAPSSPTLSACTAAKNCSPPCLAATTPPIHTPSTPTSAPCAKNCATPK